MSIYSGFASRQQQQLYDSYIEGLLVTMQRRIVKFYKKEETDEQKFIGIIKKLHVNMRKMEKYKYLEPKLSSTVEELVTMFTAPAKSDDKQSNPSEPGSFSHVAHNESKVARSGTANILDRAISIQNPFQQTDLKTKIDAFRIKRPLTTKFSSADRPISFTTPHYRDKPDFTDVSAQKMPVFGSREVSPAVKDEDHTIREVLDQYLNGPDKPILSKAQKGYMRTFKRHKNEMAMLFGNNKILGKGHSDRTGGREAKT